MPLNPGNNTVTFVVRTYNGTPDRLGVAGPVETPYVVTGNSMQPISGSDNITDTMYSEATWKCISQANEVTTTISAEDMIQFNNQEYRILAVKPYYDEWGRLNHITFMCKEESG